jgi:hypothetical protein
METLHDSDIPNPTRLTVITDLPSVSQRPLSGVLTPSVYSPSEPSPVRRSERSLPPTPTSTNALNEGATSPSERQSLRLSPSVQSRSKSPSIANLSQSSVVRKRLAQIERSNSRMSASPSEYSTRKRQVIYSGPTSPLSLSGTGKLQRHSSLRSSTGESIIGSYGDVTTPTTFAHEIRPESYGSPQSPTRRLAHKWSAGPSTSSAASLSQPGVSQQPGPPGEIAEDTAEKHHGDSPDQISSSGQGSGSPHRHVQDTNERSMPGNDQNATDLRKMRAKIDIILEMLRQEKIFAGDPDALSLKHTLQGIGHQVQSQLPKILSLLEDNRDLSASNKTNLNNESQHSGISGDLSIVHAKLDDLLAQYSNSRSVKSNEQRAETMLAIEVSPSLVPPVC